MTARGAPSGALPRSFTGLEQRLLGRFRALAVPPGSKVVVGFSGGPDSLALLAVLRRVAPLGRFEPVAVHVDHRLRHGAAAEQRRAGDLACALGVRFLGVRPDSDPRETYPGVGMEEAARRARYLALAAAAGEEGAAMVALAHHAQDQAETVLLHLLRGSGLAGAAAMAERTAVAVPWWTRSGGPTMILWRPFLGEPRPVVRAYAATTGLAAIEDPSNDDLTLRRNQLRRTVMPALDAVTGGANGVLARFARLAADDDAALDAFAEDAEDRVLVPNGGLAADRLGREPVAIQRRIVRRWVQRRAGIVPTADRVEAVLALVRSRAGGRTLEIGDGFKVVATAGQLRLTTEGSMLGAESGGAPPAKDSLSPTAWSGVDVRMIADEGVA